MTLTVRQGNTTHYKETQPQESATNPHCTVTHTHTHLYTRMGNELFTQMWYIYSCMYNTCRKFVYTCLPVRTFLGLRGFTYCFMWKLYVREKGSYIHVYISNSVYYIDTPRAQDTWMSSFKSFKSWGTIILASQISPQSLYMQYRL